MMILPPKGQIGLLQKSLLLLVACAMLTLEAFADEQGTSRRLRYSTSAKIDSAGTVRALYNPPSDVFQGPPERASRTFLEKHGSLFGITDVSSSLQTVSVIRVPGGSHIRYQQTFAGIPVLGGDVVVSTRDDGQVSMVVNNYRSAIRLGSAAPALSGEEALRRARTAMNARGATIGTPESVALLVFPRDNGAYQLVYRVRITCEDPYGDWEVIVSADDGAVLSRVDRFVTHRDGLRVTGSGMVYLSDPLSAARKLYGSPGFVDGNDADTDSLTRHRTLVPLDSITFEDGLYKLTGPGCTVTDIEQPLDPPFYSAATPDGFAFTRGDPAFEAVMCYYHITAAFRRVTDLGFQIPSLAQVRADPHGYMGKDNSHYSPSGNWISFGTGGVDDAEDANVIWHEYGHAIVYNIIPDWGGGEAGQLGEGFGDYWAASYARSLGQWGSGDPQYNWLFQWDGHNEYWGGRILNDQRTYPFGSLSVHTAGQVWSSALTGILGDLGRDVTDRLVIKSLHYLGSSPTAVDNAMALLQADRDLYGGQHLPTLTYWLGTVKNFLPADTTDLILVVNDEVPLSSIASASGRKGFNSLVDTYDGKTSGSIFQEASVPEGYGLQSTTFAGLDTTLLPAFKAVVLIAGLNTNPFNDSAKRAAIVRYLQNGGKVLVEGGEVGYAYRLDGTDEADMAFRKTVLHVSSFVNDAAETDLVSRASDLPLFQTPHPLARRVGFAPRTAYSDRDAMRTIPGEEGTVVLATWSGMPGGAGIIAHFGGPGNLQTIFLPFAVSSLADSGAAGSLVENALRYLFNPGAEIPALPDLNPPLPADFALHQNYPNPCNPTTTIRYEMPEAASVELAVYDVLGREVARLVNEWQDAGEHSVTFNAQGQASGMYFYRLKAGDVAVSRRMVVLK